MAGPILCGSLPPSVVVPRYRNISVAAPGMTKEDFKIHINEDNDLVIAMEKLAELCECQM